MLIVAAVVGLMIGTFLNVVIYRVPIMLDSEDAAPSGFNLAFPASHCPHCSTPIAAWQNVPVLSFVLLKGRCHSCSTPIGWRYLAVEVGTAALFVACVSKFGISAAGMGAAAFVSFLLAIAVIDAETLYAPDMLTMPMLWLGLLFNLESTFTPLPDAVVGAVLGYLFFWVIAKAYKLLRRIDPMGEGDFKISAALGAWLGAGAMWPIISGAGLLMLLFCLCMRLQGKGLARRVPFGPALAASATFYLFFLG